MHAWEDSDSEGLNTLDMGKDLNDLKRVKGHKGMLVLDPINVDGPIFDVYQDYEEETLMVNDENIDLLDVADVIEDTCRVSM